MENDVLGRLSVSLIMFLSAILSLLLQDVSFCFHHLVTGR